MDTEGDKSFGERRDRSGVGRGPRGTGVEVSLVLISWVYERRAAASCLTNKHFSETRMKLKYAHENTYYTCQTKQSPRTLTWHRCKVTFPNNKVKPRTYLPVTYPNANAWSDCFNTISVSYLDMFCNFKYYVEQISNVESPFKFCFVTSSFTYAYTTSLDWHVTERLKFFVLFTNE